MLLAACFFQQVVMVAMTEPPVAKVSSRPISAMRLSMFDTSVSGNKVLAQASLRYGTSLTTLIRARSICERLPSYPDPRAESAQRYLFYL